MSSFVAVEHDVNLAKRLIYFSNNPIVLGNSKLTDSSHRYQVNISNPIRHHDGTCIVIIRFEKIFTFINNSTITNNNIKYLNKESPSVIVNIEWEVSFTPSYPTEPCVWHLLKNSNSNINTQTTEFPCLKLKSYVIKGILSYLTASTNIYRINNNFNAGYTNNEYDSFNVVRENTKRSSQRVSLDNSNYITELSQCVEKKEENNTKPTSLFLSSFIFLCSWWNSLELDENSILLDNDNLHNENSSMGNMTVLDEDSNSSFPRQQCETQFLDIGGNRVQRPKREFIAIFMPNGKILSWGLSKYSKFNKNDRRLTGEINRSPDQLPLYGPVFSGVSSHTSAGHGTNKSHTSSSESTDLIGNLNNNIINNNNNNNNNFHSKHCHIIHIIRMISHRSNIEKDVLPSLVIPENILHSKIYKFSDICLYSDNPANALRKNARICHSAGEILRNITTAFRTLRHLIKGDLSNNSSLYSLKIIIPILNETVKTMLAQRQPFWAGVALCCLILPAILGNKSVIFHIALHLINPAESYHCVSLVATIFSIVGDAMKFREAEIAKSAIAEAYFCMKSNSQSISNDKLCNHNKSSLSLYHAPITECAVCGLSLLNNTKKDNNNNNVKNNNNYNNASESIPFSSVNEDGCLTVQCVRCGHGGHVAHIMDWWKDQNVNSCPKGCECNCIY